MYVMYSSSGMTANICDLPPELLRRIAVCVASPDRHLFDIAYDAAACAKSGKGLLPLASDIWHACEEVAEASPEVHNFQSRWGCITSRLLRRDVSVLAKTLPKYRASFTLKDIEKQLDKRLPVGRFCPISRPAARFILNLRMMEVSLDVTPTFFSDRDLTGAPRSGHRRVRVRDALHAPTIDITKQIVDRMALQRQQDASFKQNGFNRQWREDDLSRRLRIKDAEDWAREALPQSLAQSVVWRASAGVPQLRDMFVRLSEACLALQITAPFVPLSYHPDHELHARHTLSHTLQMSRIGRILFSWDSEFAPKLDAVDAVRAQSDLIAHLEQRHVVMQGMQGLPANIQNSIACSIYGARTLARANIALASAMDTIELYRSK